MIVFQYTNLDNIISGLQRTVQNKIRQFMTSLSEIKPTFKLKLEMLLSQLTEIKYVLLDLNLTLSIICTDL